MPNWCLNTLTVLGSEKDVAAFRKRAVGRSPKQYILEEKGETKSLLNFHRLVPIPKDVLAARWLDTINHWARENWGCRGGALDTEIVEHPDVGALAYKFVTAWSPPVALCETVAKQWPNLRLVLEYAEPNGAFQGLARFEGETKENYCINLNPNEH